MFFVATMVVFFHVSKRAVFVKKTLTENSQAPSHFLNIVTNKQIYIKRYIVEYTNIIIYKGKYIYIMYLYFLYAIYIYINIIQDI